MNSGVYRQRRPNEQHARPEPTATQLFRLQLRHGPASIATETSGLGLASSATSRPTDDPTPQMTTDENGHLLQRRMNTHTYSINCMQILFRFELHFISISKC
ncbi:hypothetical protein ElyMa_003242300 [Elysia marginata]|uniref:Uncharacterized protein n=1 Tax=Elysia marginata TaxID=1093978 RepID=A0AAV4J8A8_9GAST|nr:hypothetical protein ElyMa_003242300 [Elysia marginata]